jgi:hypothetical protein
MKNLSRQTDLPCELLSSLLIWGLQKGEVSKLGWLIQLVKHAIWADSSYVGVLIILWLFLFAAQSKEFFLNGLKKLEQ